MNKQHIVEYSQRFDQLIYALYGGVDKFDLTIEINPHLQDKLYLAPGDIVVLPQDAETITEENLESLW